MVTVLVYEKLGGHQDLSFSVNNLKVVAFNAASILAVNLKLANNNFRVSSCRLLYKRTELVRSLNFA